MNDIEQGRKEDISTDRVPQGTCNAPAGGGRVTWVFWGFLAIAAFFLLTEHRAHVFGLLPFLLLLACPLMHIFMHRGHGGPHHQRGDK
ncbi:MAG: DUF2933 domain-containing protein [Pseudomonadota bacterium]